MANLKCPRCQTVVEKPAQGTPVCPNCGFGSKAAVGGAPRPPQPSPAAVQPAARPPMPPPAAAMQQPAGPSGPPPAEPGFAGPAQPLPTPGFAGVPAQEQGKGAARTVTLKRTQRGAFVLAGAFALNLAAVFMGTAGILLGLVAAVGYITGLVMLQRGAGLFSPRHRLLARIGAFCFIAAIILTFAARGQKAETLEELRNSLGMLFAHDLFLVLGAVFSLWAIGRVAERVLLALAVGASIAVWIFFFATVDNLSTEAELKAFLATIIILASMELALPAIAALIVGVALMQRYPHLVTASAPAFRPLMTERRAEAARQRAMTAKPDTLAWFWDGLIGVLAAILLLVAVTGWVQSAQHPEKNTYPAAVIVTLLAGAAVYWLVRRIRRRSAAKKGVAVGA